MSIGKISFPAGIGTDQQLERVTKYLNVGDGMGYVPIGGIIMWSGILENIPETWALCNGLNGTPDLTDRFIVGAGSTYAPKTTGGSATHTLTVGEMPSHTHTQNAHIHVVGYPVAPAATQCPAASVNTTPDYASGHFGYNTSSVTATNNNTGGGGAHENRPPYYALAFIMRIQ